MWGALFDLIGIAFFSELFQSVPALRFATCQDVGDCTVVGVDLDRDGALEYCLLAGSAWPGGGCYAPGAPRR